MDKISDTMRQGLRMIAVGTDMPHANTVRALVRRGLIVDTTSVGYVLTEDGINAAWPESTHDDEPVNTPGVDESARLVLRSNDGTVTDYVRPVDAHDYEPSCSCGPCNVAWLTDADEGGAAWTPEGIVRVPATAPQTTDPQTANVDDLMGYDVTWGFGGPDVTVHVDTQEEAQSVAADVRAWGPVVGRPGTLPWQQEAAQLHCGASLVEDQPGYPSGPVGRTFGEIVGDPVPAGRWSNPYAWPR